MTRQPTLVGCMQLGLPCCCIFGVQAERLVKERHDTAAYPCWMHAVGIAMLLRFWRSSGEAGQGEAWHGSLHFLDACSGDCHAAAFLAFKRRGWSRRGMTRQPTLVGCMQLGLPCCCVFGA